MIGALIAAAVVVAVVRSELMWELLTGLALVVFILAAIRLDAGIAVTAAAILGGCIWHWAWV